MTSAPPLYRRRRCHSCGSLGRVVSGAWIKHERIRRGLRQKDLATRVGITTDHVGKIEQGLRRPPEALVLELGAHVPPSTTAKPYRSTL